MGAGALPEEEPALLPEEGGEPGPSLRRSLWAFAAEERPVPAGGGGRGGRRAGAGGLAGRPRVSRVTMVSFVLRRNLWLSVAGPQCGSVARCGSGR